MTLKESHTGLQIKGESHVKYNKTRSGLLALVNALANINFLGALMLTCIGKYLNMH